MRTEIQQIHPLSIPLHLRQGLEELCILLNKEDTRLAKEVLQVEREGIPYVGLQSHFIQDSMVMVATIKSDVVGFLSYFDDGSKRAIDLVCVHPEYRRQGIAKQLVLSALENAPTFVDVSVVMVNEAGRALYESLGFKPFVMTLTKVN